MAAADELGMSVGPIHGSCFILLLQWFYDQCDRARSVVEEQTCMWCCLAYSSHCQHCVSLVVNYAVALLHVISDAPCLSSRCLTAHV